MNIDWHDVKTRAMRAYLQDFENRKYFQGALESSGIRPVSDNWQDLLRTIENMRSHNEKG